MKLSNAIAGASLLPLLPGIVAQSVQFSPNDSPEGVKYRINIPSSTASSKTNSIFFQIEAPSDVEWVALGQGDQMTGAHIFVMYSSSQSNVTLSPRIGTGHREPKFDPDANVFLLDGTGISDGKMTANVRCDGCLSWEGGEMDPTDRSSKWIWAMKEGSPLSSSSVSEKIGFHSIKGGFDIDLREAAGGSSANPFLEMSSDDSSSSGVSSTGPTVSAVTIMRKRSIHGVMMSIVFVVLFPVFALSLHLIPYSKTVTRIHAPLQMITLCIALAGFGVGVSLAVDIGKTSAYHPIIGYIVVVYLTLFQPALGYFQHLHFKRTGEKAVQGIIHRWLGRLILTLAIINGGLGFRFSGIGNPGVPKSGVIAYIVVASVMGLLYAAVVIFKRVAGRRENDSEQDALSNENRDKDEHG